MTFLFIDILYNTIYIYHNMEKKQLKFKIAFSDKQDSINDCENVIHSLFINPQLDAPNDTEETKIINKLLNLFDSTIFEFVENPSAILHYQDKQQHYQDKQQQHDVWYQRKEIWRQSELLVL